jgi:hypothetical protein
MIWLHVRGKLSLIKSVRNCCKKVVEAPVKSKTMRKKLVQIGARRVFEGLMKKADKCKSLSALKLRSEAEGARTLNLRIDSPNTLFVSAC